MPWAKKRKAERKKRERKKYSPNFCWVALCLGIPSTLSQSIYNSVLAFSSCLYESWRSARGESLDLLRPFLSMCPALGMHVAFLVLHYTWQLLKALLLHISPFPGFCLLFAYYPFPQDAPDSTLAFKCFWQKPPRKPWECCEWGEIKAGAYISPCRGHWLG